MSARCAYIFDDDPCITDANGCRLQDGHDGPHEFVDQHGNVWCWETDWECLCEHCMQCEGDYCVIYWCKDSRRVEA